MILLDKLLLQQVLLKQKFRISVEHEILILKVLSLIEFHRVWEIHALALLLLETLVRRFLVCGRRLVCMGLCIKDMIGHHILFL